jgi:hypothetical protein
MGFDPRESVTVLIVLAKSLGQILVNQGYVLVKNSGKFRTGLARCAPPNSLIFMLLDGGGTRNRTEVHGYCNMFWTKRQRACLGQDVPDRSGYRSNFAIEKADRSGLY